MSLFGLRPSLLLIVVVLAASSSGLRNDLLNGVSCGDQRLDCDAEVAAGRNLSDLCPNIKLDLSRPTQDHGLLLYYQVV